MESINEIRNNQTDTADKSIRIGAGGKNVNSVNGNRQMNHSNVYQICDFKH